MTQHDTLSIVGGGWSFKDVDPAALPGHVIAVNEAAVLLDAQHVTYGLTMDRLWFEHRYEQLRKRDILFFARRSALQNVKDWRDHAGIVPFDNDNKATYFAMPFGILNGTNSGMCALNLAYQFRPKQLYLFGFDHCRSPKGDAYWHEPYPWAKAGGATTDGKYGEWAKQYEQAARSFEGIGCKVFNVSMGSAIRAFTRIAPYQIGVER